MLAHYSRGISSAREISRRCEYEPAFQWSTGLNVIHHHNSSDFRIEHREALDDLFTQVLAVLSLEGLVTLEPAQAVPTDLAQLEGMLDEFAARTLSLMSSGVAASNPAVM